MIRNKILVISHDGSQTGAPILLLNLMKILKENGYIFHCIIKNGFGDLINQFYDVAENCVIYNMPLKNSFINKYKKRFKKKQVESKIKDLLAEVDYVISNTITNGDILPFINKHSKVPIISYVHELKMATEYFTKNVYLQNVLQMSDYFLTPSHSVKCFLKNAYLIDEKKIAVINSFVPEMIPSNGVTLVDFDKENNIHASFIIGGMGTTDWRKGTDIFIQVAVQVFRMLPEADIQFIWKGGLKGSLEYKRLVHDIEKAGLLNRVLLLEHSENVSTFYKCIHLFLLTSREDPYPLVVLEAAVNKIPSVCFSGSGGASEFIEGDAGTVINYLDLVSMANQVAYYYQNGNLLLAQGARAYEKVERWHLDKELIVEQIEKVFNSLQ